MLVYGFVKNIFDDENQKHIEFIVRLSEIEALGLLSSYDQNDTNTPEDSDCRIIVRHIAEKLAASDVLDP